MEVQHSGSSEFDSFYQSLRPDDALTTHTAPAGRTFEGVATEKLANTRALQRFTGNFKDDISRELALAAIDLMNEFHFNQFRGGKEARHFSDHTRTVALRAAEEVAADETPYGMYPIVTSSGHTLSPATVAFITGALHDSREDYHINFAGTSSSLEPVKAAEIVDTRIHRVFDPIIGASATEQILNVIRLLSLDNGDEFPTAAYVNGISSDYYARAVKRADYSHNLETFPDFTPTYALMVVPAQYWAIVRGSSYETKYDESLIRNIAAWRSEEIVPWDRSLRERRILTGEHLAELFERYHEPQAFERISHYYSELSEKIQSGAMDSYLRNQQLNRADVIDKIERFQMMVTSLNDHPPLPEYLRGIPAEEASPTLPQISQSSVGDTKLRILGPIASWGGEITFSHADRARIEEQINSTSAETGLRIPGYFIASGSEEQTFHISRYARHAEQEVPTKASYQSVMDLLGKKISSAGISATVHEEVPSSERTIRVVLGLDEGYFEGRKNEVLAQATQGLISTTEELKYALSTLLGDYASLGIDLEGERDFSRALEVVRAASLAKTHTLAEVKAFLGGSFEVCAAHVYSAAPEYATPYQEPAALIIAPATKATFEKLIALGDFFKQARFSVENIAAGSVVNVELQNFSTIKAAAMI